MEYTQPNRDQYETMGQNPILKYNPVAVSACYISIRTRGLKSSGLEQLLLEIQMLQYVFLILLSLQIAHRNKCQHSVVDLCFT